MKIEVVYSKDARKHLRGLDKKEALKIALKIKFYTEQENPIKQAKKLKPPLGDLYRFRVGDYRAIFEIDSKGNITILTILSIKHRKDLY